MTKTYYLSPTRSILVGVILSFFLLALLFIGFIPEQSAWENFQSMVLDFRDIDNFIGSFLMLMIKLGLLSLIINYFKNAQKIVRAKIDNKGFYYKANMKSKYEWLTHEMENLVFIPFSDIVNISLKENWLGNHIFLSTTKESTALISLNSLTKKEKQEIVEIIQSWLNK